MHEGLLSDRKLKALSNGAGQVIIGTVTACLAANVAFMLLFTSASVGMQGWGRGVGGLFAVGALVGIFLSALPALVIMVVLVAVKARTWWAYTVGGLVTAAVTVSPLNWFSGHSKTYVTIMVLGMMAAGGMIGGVAAWLALRRCWRVPDRPTPADLAR